MLACVTSGLVIAVLAMGALAQDGCNAAVRSNCPNGVASVCRTDKCRGAEVNGDAFKRKIVEEHNKYRRMPFSNGQFGADMMELTWDDQLANAALGLVQNLCRENGFDHDDKKCRVTQRYSSVGQNLFSMTDEYKDEAVVASEAVADWYSEISDKTVDGMFPYQSTPGTGHYTQMVWARTYRIGCAMVRSKSPDFDEWGTYEVLVACNYSPSGNVKQHGNVFDPASKLASACRPGSANRGSGLCQITDENQYRKQVGLDTLPSSRN